MKNYKKYLTIILIILILLCSFSVNCFASNSIYNTLPENALKIIDSNIMPELKDMNYHCFGWYHRKMGYLIWFFDKTTCSDDFKISLGVSEGKWYCSGSCSGKQYNFDNNGNLVSSGNLQMGSGRWDEFHNGYLYLQNITMYKTDGEVFFLAPPLTVGVAMVETLEKVNLGEQLKIMITGFLKYLIVFVISVIAFWKGWQFLLRHFKTA